MILAPVPNPLAIRRLGFALPANRFALALDETALTIAPGESAEIQVSATTVAGSVETATLSVHGLPAGASGEFSAATLETDGSDGPITLTISVDAEAEPVALDSFQVRATAPSQTKSRTATLTIEDTLMFQPAEALMFTPAENLMFA